MSFQRFEIGDGEARRPPFPDAPTAEILFGADGTSPLAALHVEVPPGGGMPDHAHGDSHTLLIPLEGEVVITDEGSDAGTALGPGSVGSIAIGDRVRLENPGAGPARLLVVIAPPEFVEHIASWPLAGDTIAQPA